VTASSHRQPLARSMNDWLLYFAHQPLEWPIVSGLSGMIVILASRSLADLVVCIRPVYIETKSSLGTFTN